MTSDIRNILGHTNIFNNQDKVNSIEKIGSSKYKVEKDDKYYVFSFYDLNQFDDFENEDLVNEVLAHAGLNPLTIYEKGIMPDIEKSYKVYEYRNEISLRDFLEKANDSQQVKIGKELSLIHI